MNDRIDVLIRADASHAIGSGHVMRCIALAEALAERGDAVRFACRALDSGLHSELRGRGLAVDILDSSGDDAEATMKSWVFAPDWAVVDHYALDAQWHRRLAALGVRIAVIDDLADRPLDCDLLVDQNAIEAIHARYSDVTPARCRRLLGPRYTLLRQEFRHVLAQRIARSREEQSAGEVILFLGGADADGLTSRLLERLDTAMLPGPLHVLVGSMNQQGAALSDWCSARGVRCSVGLRSVAELLVDARAAIVSCGMFAVELQAVEVPSLLLPLSDIQRTVAQRFAGQGGAVVLEPAQIAQPAALSIAVTALCSLSSAPLGRAVVPVDGAQAVVAALHEVAQ
jgi:UDP-2,4-diacetamido-2,4,6-trideoxy-beta-L-altropyranose hydrolase